ncbi:MAG: biotin/lipoyl-binding carrier protein [Variovorax sp.]
MAKEIVKAEITGSVWKVLVAKGERVEEEQPLVIVESMKMEIPVLSTASGTVSEIFVNEGDDVAEGEKVATIDA